MKPGRASHILRAAHTFRKRHIGRRKRRRGDPPSCEFVRTPWTAGRDARPMARPIRLRTFYVLLGSRRLGLDGLVAELTPCRKPTAPSADAPDRPACRPRLGQCLLPWGDDAAHHLGLRLLYIFVLITHWSPHTLHSATTHGTVPVASRRRRSQPGVGLDLFVCMYSLSPHIVRFKHVSMRW